MYMYRCVYIYIYIYREREREREREMYILALSEAPQRRVARLRRGGHGLVARLAYIRQESSQMYIISTTKSKKTQQVASSPAFLFNIELIVRSSLQALSSFVGFRFRPPRGSTPAGPRAPGSWPETIYTYTYVCIYIYIYITHVCIACICARSSKAAWAPRRRASCSRVMPARRSCILIRARNMSQS